MSHPPSILVCVMLAEHHAQNMLLLSQVRGRSLYETVLETMAQSRLTRSILVTDIPQAKAFAEKLGVDTTTPSPRYAVEGRTECELVEEAIESDGNATIVLFDWRWPLLSAETIENALRSFQSSDQNILVTVSRTEDNPAQVKRGFRLLETGIVAFLDDGHVLQSQWIKDFQARELRNGNEASYLPTRPFFMDWTGFTGDRVLDEDFSALCWLCYLPGETYYFVHRNKLGDSYYSQSVVLGLYRRESRNLARHMVSSYWLNAAHPPQIVGLDPFAGTASPGAICIREGDNVFLCLPDQPPSPTAILRVWPFLDGTIEPDKAFEIVPGRFEEQSRFLWNKTSYLTVLLPGSWSKTADGFYFSFMAPDKQDADFMEPIILHEGPYRYDSSKRALTTSEGIPINGRQYFAPIYTINTALTILRFDDLRKAEQLRTSVKSSVFALPQQQTYHVYNEFDLAKIG